MRSLMIAAALTLFACAANAQESGGPSAEDSTQILVPADPVAALLADPDTSLDPADAPEGVYTLDSRHAFVTWRVRHTGLGIVVGRFETIAGELMFNPETPAASSINVTIDANSASTGVRERNGDLRFDREIRNVLGAAEHPEIRFVSTQAYVTGPAAGLIEGELTLNGQTHPVTLAVTYHGGRFVALRGKYALGFSARTIIDRRRWDVGSLIFNQFAGDEVEIVIEAEFEKQ